MQQLEIIAIIHAGRRDAYTRTRAQALLEDHERMKEVRERREREKREKEAKRTAQLVAMREEQMKAKGFQRLRATQYDELRRRLAGGTGTSIPTDQVRSRRGPRNEHYILRARQLIGIHKGFLLRPAGRGTCRRGCWQRGAGRDPLGRDAETPQGAEGRRGGAGSLPSCRLLTNAILVSKQVIGDDLLKGFGRVRVSSTTSAGEGGPLSASGSVRRSLAAGQAGRQGSGRRAGPGAEDSPSGTQSPRGGFCRAWGSGEQGSSGGLGRGRESGTHEHARQEGATDGGDAQGTLACAEWHGSAWNAEAGRARRRTASSPEVGLSVRCCCLECCTIGAVLPTAGRAVRHSEWARAPFVATV